MRNKNTTDILVTFQGDNTIGLEAVSAKGALKIERLSKKLGRMTNSILLLDTADTEIAFARIDSKRLSTLTLG
jgi:hypothetical protein